MSEQFALAIEHDVDVGCDAWPTREERRSETLGGNRDYFELGISTWNEVKAIIESERTTIREIHGSSDPDAAFESWFEEQYEDGGFGLGVDLGVNSLVAALRACHCLPFYSCNGGAFGEAHNDSHPVVAFFWRKEVAPLIRMAAVRSEAGLMHNHSGGVTAYARNVEAMIGMAEFLYTHRQEIASSRRRKSRITPPSNGQQNLL